MTIKSRGKGRVRHTLSLGFRKTATAQFSENDLARFLLSIGQAIYEFEDSVKKSPKFELEISIPSVIQDNVDLRNVAASLERLVSFVLLTEVSIDFVQSKQPYQTTAAGLSHPTRSVFLFSGGVDSVSGTLLATQHSDSIAAVFCSHLHQGRVTAITRRLGETYLQRLGVTLYEVPAPSMTVSGYSQTRGFLYIMSAAAVGIWLKARRLVVSECGPTMFQPKFAPADQTTMTTHPFILERAQEIIDYLATGIRIVTPFENLTKAEVMAVCPKPRAFPKTHSCVSQRLPQHDGTCYGCVVRRLAAIASGSPDVDYARNPVVDHSANSGNLLALLNFNLHYIASPRGLPAYQHEMIFGNRKGPLFKRFCLDNFAALYRMKSKGHALAPAVEQVYQAAIKVVGGVEPLRSRLRELKNMKTNLPKIGF